jgi:hypothetical protein
VAKNESAMRFAPDFWTAFFKLSLPSSVSLSMARTKKSGIMSPCNCCGKAAKENEDIKSRGEIFFALMIRMKKDFIRIAGSIA